MICHDYKCLFVHIPKVAGQSVENYFLKKIGLNWDSRSPLLLRRNYQPGAGPLTLDHMKASDYLRFHYISRDLFEDYYKFSFVRNPWSRAVSIYKFLGYHAIMNFDNFVFYQIPKLMQTKWWFVAPQYDMLYENGHNMMDFIGKFENIKDDFAKVCTHLGFEDTDLPHINKAEPKNFKGLKLLVKNPSLLTKLSFSKPLKKDHKEYYTPKINEQIQQIYKKDIETFGYDF